MNCKLYRKRTSWDVLDPVSVHIRKTGNLLALIRKRKKNKTGERNLEKNENEDAVIHLNDNNIQLASNKTKYFKFGLVNWLETRVIIAGDSMLKSIKGRKLSSQISNQGLIYVKAFPGATVEDMSDYIMPSLCRKPEEVTLHVDTNNLKFSERREIAEGIVNLRLKIQNHSPDGKITISSLISRSDQTLNGKIKDLDKIVNNLPSSMPAEQFHTPTLRTNILMLVDFIWMYKVLDY